MTSEQGQLLVCNCLEVNTMQADGEQEKMKRGGWQLWRRWMNLGEMVIEGESPEPWGLRSLARLGAWGAWEKGSKLAYATKQSIRTP